ncbi:MAG: ATP-binding protein [Spirochaetales bacterium]|nr:ATP-binding protein [Spirochaetales bacterium]
MELNKRLIYTPLLFILLFVGGLFIMEGTTADQTFYFEQFHVYLEVVGSFCILLVSFLLFADQDKLDFNTTGIIVGLLFMGILDTFHGLSHPGESFVFLHNMAVLTGSLGFFSFIVFNCKFSGFVLRKRGLILFTAVAVLTGTLSLVLIEYMPTMLVGGEFTSLAIVMNVISGILFISAGVYFFILNRTSPDKIKYLFIITTLLQGAGSITFGYSELWCSTWWSWHVLRFLGNTLLIIFIFISAEERRRIVARQNLEIKDINTKLNNYTYTISHDLKEPIRSIRTFSEFILEDYEEQFDETGKDYFNRIIIASNKMAAMIDDLLILSRIGKNDVKFEKTNLNEIVEDVIESLEMSIHESNSDIACETLPTVFCQISWMKLVFSNFITNSIKYRDHEKKRNQIVISSRDQRDIYEIFIQDNGIGLEEDQFDKIFGLFRRAYSKNDKDGSGAGLAIIKDIIDQHNGTVFVKESEPGKGTTFCFTLPKGVIKNE